MFKSIKAKFRGWVGESGTNLLSDIFLPKDKYYKYNDILLPKEQGTTQIDHIVVSQYGIFVIETKNLSGWIYGDQYNKYWTQKFFKKTYRFYNPIHQNYGHIKTLEALLPRY